MRKSWIAAVVALLAVVAPGMPMRAHAAKVQPDIAYVGWWTAGEQTHGWVVRAIGVNGSWAATIQVSYWFPDGSSATLQPATLRFFSGAGSSEWSTESYTVTVPQGAVGIGADVKLIELKKPGTIRDEVIVQNKLIATGGNLYCNPLLYLQCP